MLRVIGKHDIKKAWNVPIHPEVLRNPHALISQAHAKAKAYTEFIRGHVYEISQVSGMS